MTKNKEKKRYYFSSIGEIIWTIASFIYCAWYGWYHFIESNPIFDDFSKVTQFLMFWAGGVAILVTFFRFKDGPDFLNPPKFEKTDLFAFIVTGIALFFGLR